MRKHRFAPVLTSGFIFAFMLSAFAGSAAAQSTPAAESAEHPAHIHVGMCPDVGEVAFPLDMVVPMDESMGTPDAMSSPMADMPMTGTPMAGSMMVLGSTTMVDASMDDILGSEHAVNLHLSQEQADVYIACGDLTGTPEDGELVIDLEEQNDSGVSGQATLTDNGDGTSTLMIEVHHVGSSMEGTPVSTPMP